ncbi:TPA: hypothetical protein SLE35_003365 [Morganella morganii]|nr:hypothetical protein [Morganella morganii]
MSDMVNAGVDGGSGYTFQRCCVVYLLFDDYEKLSSSSIDYFICVEHHDDFLFAFFDENSNIQTINTYQAKKSRNDWKTDQEFCEIIGKISLVGNQLVKDTSPKSDGYKHVLSFLTNRNIHLQGKKTPKQKQQIEKIQISNTSVNYSDLHDEIKENIQKKLVNGRDSDFNQLPNITFNFIDLPQSYKGWKRVLTGLSIEVLGSSINDHEAVVTTLMSLLQDIELEYNDSGYVLLSDKSKRLTKQKVDETFNIFTESKKAFDFWRAHADALAECLTITLPIRRRAQELLDNCFDFFKDIQQLEYKKIYKYVSENKHVDEKHINETDCVIELYQNYIKENNSRLEKHMIAFAIIAAYVETRGIYV